MGIPYEVSILVHGLFANGVQLNAIVSFRSGIQMSIDDYEKDGGEELFTKMHCVLITNL